MSLSLSLFNGLMRRAPRGYNKSRSKLCDKWKRIGSDRIGSLSLSLYVSLLSVSLVYISGGCLFFHVFAGFDDGADVVFSTRNQISFSLTMLIVLCPFKVMVWILNLSQFVLLNSTWSESLSWFFKGNNTICYVDPSSWYETKRLYYWLESNQP